MKVRLHILKHMAALSDERICARGVYDPDFQYFCGAEYFPHERPIDRSSMTNWRERIGPAVECMGKDKAHEPYVFGCRVSVAVTHKWAPAGQFVTHIPALHGNPDDGHTLKDVIEEMKAWTGVSVARIFVDKGYRGHTPQQAQGLSIGPDAWHHTHHQEGAPQTIRRRAHHRSAQQRWPVGPKRPQGKRRQPYQRHPRRRRRQLSPAIQVAQAFLCLDRQCPKNSKPTTITPSRTPMNNFWVVHGRPIIVAIVAPQASNPANRHEHHPRYSVAFLL